MRYASSLTLNILTTPLLGYHCYHLAGSLPGCGAETGGRAGQRVTGAGLSAAACKARTLQPSITPDVF